jgi:hypothetical protein
MGTKFWRKPINLEKKNVKPDFEFKDDNQVPIGYKHINCHMILDVKLDLTWKARYVVGGHQTDLPTKDMVYMLVLCIMTVFLLLSS